MANANQPLHPETVSNHPVVVAFQVADVETCLSAAERTAARTVARVSPRALVLATTLAERFGFEEDFDVEAARRYLKLEEQLRPSIRELTVLLAQHEDTLRRAKQGPGTDFWTFWKIVKARAEGRKPDDHLVLLVDEIREELATRPPKPVKKGETPTP